VSEQIKASYKIAMSLYERDFKVLDKEHTPGFAICKLLTNQMTILDEESYKLSAFKSIYGEKSWPIIRSMGWSRATYDNLMELTTPKSENLIESIMLSKRTTDVFNKYLKFKTKGVIKAIESTKDKYSMVLNSMFYNFTSKISLRPPRVELPSIGVVIRICRMQQNAELADRLDEFRARRTLQIFQAGLIKEEETYFADVNHESLGEFEIVNGSLKVTDENIGSCLIINRASENRMRRRIESLMPTNTAFKFTNKALTDVDLKDYQILIGLIIMNLILKEQKEKTLLFRLKIALSRPM